MGNNTKGEQAMAKRKYTFRPGSRVTGIKPQVVGDWLEEIRRKHGRLTTEVILQESNDEECPVYDYFHWDDNDAMAREYRLILARQLVRSVQVVFDDKPDEPP